MARRSPRELALASVAMAVLAVALWTYRAGGRPATNGAPPAAPAANAAQPGKNAPSSGVNLDALNAERPEPAEGTRNPFRFKPPPAPPPPPPIVKPPVEKTGVPSVTPGPSEPPPPPRITLKYIGDVADPQKQGAKIAVLTDGRNVFHGREGEVIEGRYRILRIGVESVDLAYIDGRGRQTIRQTGQ
jgi:hypothetical protein